LYCDGFGDQASVNWLKSFRAFGTIGLPVSNDGSSSSREHLEAMIRLGAVEVRVRMPITKTAKYQLVGAANGDILKELSGYNDTSRLRIQTVQSIGSCILRI